jgi:hypothetical protein
MQKMEDSASQCICCQSRMLFGTFNIAHFIQNRVSLALLWHFTNESKKDSATNMVARIGLLVGCYD